MTALGGAQRLKLFVLGAAALVKFGLLARYGALHADDTPVYLQIADAIRHDPGLIDRIPEWRDHAIPALAFRPYGYPAVIALAQAVAGTGYDTLLAAMQIALSLLVGAWLFDTASLAAGGRHRIGTAAACFYFAGTTLLWDQTILSDCLFGFLVNLVLLRLGRDLALGRRPRHLMALGIAWGAGTLLRDVGLYLAVLPAAICFFAVTPKARPRALAAFLLPVLLIAGGYEAWNAHRTGEPFISVTDAANYLRPDFEIARTGLADPFDDDSTVAQVARAHPGEYDFPHQFALLQEIHDRLGLESPVALARVERAHLLRTLWVHPVAYARYVAGNLDPRSFAVTLFDPIAAMNDYCQLGLPPFRRVVPGIGIASLRDLVRGGDWGGLALAIASALSVTGASLAWLATLAGVPLLLRRHKFDGPARLAVAMLLTALGGVGFFALVHTETRLVLPFVPAGLIATSYVAARLRRGTGSSIIKA